MKIVDLRSDTITRPTPAMREAMMQAEVGDDVFGEDPTINRLQETIAQMTGKEAALFVASGTQGNQVSINAHTQPGQEIIVEKESHIFNYECGSPAMLAGVQIHPLIGNRGVITVEQIQAAVRPPDIHHAQTALICLENTHNRAGGAIFPLEEMKRISAFARERGLKVHLDGARLWNASVATGISIAEYCRYVDSVSLCFSKGLGAPVGSVVAGEADFIARARYYRKAYGGGMRQAGILAAAALYALEHHLPRLADDHRRARRLAEAIAGLPGVQLNLEEVQTNIIIFQFDSPRMSARELVENLAEHGVRMFSFGANKIRMVTHLDVDDEGIDYAIEIFRKLLG